MPVRRQSLHTQTPDQLFDAKVGANRTAKTHLQGKCTRGPVKEYHCENSCTVSAVDRVFSF